MTQIVGGQHHPHPIKILVNCYSVLTPLNLQESDGTYQDVIKTPKPVKTPADSEPENLLGRGYRDSLLETAQEAATIASTRVHRWAQYMSQKRYYLSVCIRFQEWAHLSQLSLCNHNSDCLLHSHLSISVQLFSRMAPHFFGHQDSPSNLAESLYPHAVGENSQKNWVLPGAARPNQWCMFPYR